VAIDSIKLVDCAYPKRTFACNYRQIGCSSGGCFSPDQECDFADDCGDGTDEKAAICANYKDRCDFETDSCNWYNDRDDDFNWNRKSSQSRLSGMEPQIDHTKGISSLYYTNVDKLAKTHDITFVTIIINNLAKFYDLLVFLL